MFFCKVSHGLLQYVKLAYDYIVSYSERFMSEESFAESGLFGLSVMCFPFLCFFSFSSSSTRCS